MSQSATLYEISKKEFQKLENDPSCFRFDIAEQYETFEQNFDGLLFVLTKCVTEDKKEMINLIFYPSNFLGESIDFDSIDFDSLDNLSILGNETISFLTSEQVGELKNILSQIDKTEFLKNYIPQELNENGVYPEIWHEDESSEQAFNKRHLEEGFDALCKLFNQAGKNENYILSFVG